MMDRKGFRFAGFSLEKSPAVSCNCAILPRKKARHAVAKVIDGIEVAEGTASPVLLERPDRAKGARAMN